MTMDNVEGADGGDVNVDLDRLFGESPFINHLGIELVTIEPGYAEAKMPFREELVATPDGRVAQGGAVFSLVDSVGGTAVSTQTGEATPTIDLRIDYHSPAVTDLFAEATVVHLGDTVASVDVGVYDTDDEIIASAQGTFKVGGQSPDSPWVSGREAAFPED
jgi:uncharacterized protein (TIGR00369 family)